MAHPVGVNQSPRGSEDIKCQDPTRTDRIHHEQTKFGKSAFSFEEKSEISLVDVIETTPPIGELDGRYL
jgi:hypothetical protein